MCREGNRERDRDRDRQRQRQTEADRQTDREREKERFNSQNMSCISLNKMIHKPSCQYFLYP